MTNNTRWYEVRAHAGYAILAERVQASDAAAAIRLARPSLMRMAGDRPLRNVRAVIDE